MINRSDENSGAGSCGNPYAGGAGSAGPSCKVSGDEQPGAGPESRDPARAHSRKNKEAPRPERAKKVLRKTELHGNVRTREDATRIRKRMMHDLKASCNDEIVVRFERTLGEFTDSLIERQNRIEDALLLQIAELGQRTDDLEQYLLERGRTAPVEPEVSG